VLLNKTDFTTNITDVRRLYRHFNYTI